MGYSDGVQYFHGSGSSAGPLTVANTALTGVTQAGTTLTYTVGSGQVIPGQTYVLAGGAPTVTSVVTIAQILTGAGGTGTATVNASQTVTATTATGYPPIYGDPWLAAGSQYSNLELDFGPPLNAAAYPFLQTFPSYAEKGYIFPPEQPGAGGSINGVHIIIGSPFNTLTSCNFQVVTSMTTNALIATGVIASRPITLAQMQVNGGHYFIPVVGTAVLEFLRVYGAVTGSNPTLGTLLMYWGPKTGGEE